MHIVDDEYEVLEGDEELTETDTKPDVVDQEQEDVDPEVVDPEEEDSDTADAQTQTPEENAHFKKMRLKAEEQVRKKLEAEYEAREQALAHKARLIEERESEKRVMDEYLSDDRVMEKADEEGISEEAAKKMLRLEAERYIESEKSKIRSRFDMLESQKRVLRGDRHFSLLEKDVEAILAANPELDFQTVYYHQKGLRSEELEKQLLTKTEKKTVANIQDRSRRRIGTGEGTGDLDLVPSAVLTKKGLEMAAAFGNDPREIAKYVTQKRRR